MHCLHTSKPQLVSAKEHCQARMATDEEHCMADHFVSLSCTRFVGAGLQTAIAILAS